MNCDVEFQNVEATDQLKLRAEIDEVTSEFLPRLEVKAKGSLPDATSCLRALVEQKPDRSLFHVRLTLNLRGGALEVHEEQKDLRACFREAFHKIERQLEQRNADAREDRIWHRIARRRETRRAMVGPDEEVAPESFFDAAAPHLNRLSEFVRHMLALLEANGDLAEGELEPDEVVDTVLLRAYREFAAGRGPDNVESWMEGLATEHMGAQSRRSQQERERLVSIEEDIPEIPPTEEVSTLGEETLDFYQPDEDLKVEDVIPDVEVPPPDQPAELRELRRCVRTQIRSLPREWRQMLQLHFVEDLPITEIARIFEVSEPDISQSLENARQQLRRALVQAGCSFNSRAGAESSEGR